MPDKELMILSAPQVVSEARFGRAVCVAYLCSELTRT